MSLIKDVSRSVATLKKRLDGLNCSLAERALPDSRRGRVSELSLKDKAAKAGHKTEE